jgi:hypothetical protein
MVAAGFVSTLTILHIDIKRGLRLLIAQEKNPERSNEATAAIAALLRRRHRIQPPDDSP